MNYIDKFLNSITMYRLVLYGLFVIATFGIIFAFLGWLPLNGWQMLVNLVVIIASCAVFNYILGYFFKVPVNAESSYISSLILFLILPPADSLVTIIILVVACLVAMASKFVINIKGKHIFNPAAFAALALGVSGLIYPTWWVGSLVILPFVGIVGFLLDILMGKIADYFDYRKKM